MFIRPCLVSAMKMHNDLLSQILNVFMADLCGEHTENVSLKITVLWWVTPDSGVASSRRFGETG
jgi:hypothetical protein